MEYINDINIREAIIHIVDSNAKQPVLNEYGLELDEDKYKYLYKHVEKVLKDEDLKYAKFNPERNIVKEVVQDYLNGISTDLITLSKELANQLFITMKSNVNIPEGDLIIVSIETDKGPMIGILKMDYVKNFTHQVLFLDEKIGIDIVPQATGLPSSGQKIQKAAFIKPIRDDESYNLMILDKQKRSKEDEYGANYFVSNFLGASIVTNERDMTKTFFNASENWVRNCLYSDAAKAEKIRTAIKNKLKEESFKVDDVAEELFGKNQIEKESFLTDIKMKAIEEVVVDREWADKKFKRTRINIDKQIDLYIDEDVYHDPTKFEVIRNGDGSINMVIKNVVNYIEK